MGGAIKFHQGSILIAAPAAVLSPGLDWRACYRAVRTEHAAVSRLGSQRFVTVLAFIEPLARIGRHVFGFGVPTFGASQRRTEDRVTHRTDPDTVDG